MANEMCPCCGQRLPGSGSADELLAAMRKDRRDVYLAGDGSGRWYLTRGHQQGEPLFFTAHAVMALVAQGRIRRTWPTCEDSYSIVRSD